MMFKEKMILFSIAVMILAVFTEALPYIYPELDIMTNRNEQKNDPLLNESNISIGGSMEPPSLSINEWNKDIFHDRSNIYNSWFKLTGITEFENGNKAIVNGEIVHEMNRVRGFTVTSITETQVVLQRNEYRVTLKMEK